MTTALTQRLLRGFPTYGSAVGVPCWSVTIVCEAGDGLRARTVLKAITWLTLNWFGADMLARLRTHLTELMAEYGFTERELRWDWYRTYHDQLKDEL